MKKFKRWLKKNGMDIALTVGGALCIKLFGDVTRCYSAFGGEDLLFVAAIGYWVWRWLEDKNFIKEKAPNR